MTPKWSDLGIPALLSLEERLLRRDAALDAAELDALLMASADERYRTTMERLAEKHEVWTVWDGDDLALYSDDVRYIPLYPAEQVARAASGDDQVLSFVPIPIDDFTDQIGSFLLEEEIFLALCPTPMNLDIIRLSWADFLIDLVGVWEHVHCIELPTSKLFRAHSRKHLDHRLLRPL